MNLRPEPGGPNLAVEPPAIALPRPVSGGHPDFPGLAGQRGQAGLIDAAFDFRQPLFVHGASLQVFEFSPGQPNLLDVRNPPLHFATRKAGERNIPKYFQDQVFLEASGNARPGERRDG